MSRNPRSHIRIVSGPQLQPGDARSNLADREREKLALQEEMHRIALAMDAATPLYMDPNCGASLASGLSQRIGTSEEPELLRGLIVRVALENDNGKVYYNLPVAGLSQYPVGESNARTWLRRPVLYPLS